MEVPICQPGTTKRWTVPDQIQQKHLCQEVGEAGEESFKMGIMKEGHNKKHSSVRKWLTKVESSVHKDSYKRRQE